MITSNSNCNIICTAAPCLAVQKRTRVRNRFYCDPQVYTVYIPLNTNIKLTLKNGLNACIDEKDSRFQICVRYMKSFVKQNIRFIRHFKACKTSISNWKIILICKRFYFCRKI